MLNAKRTLILSLICCLPTVVFAISNLGPLEARSAVDILTNGELSQNFAQSPINHTAFCPQTITCDNGINPCVVSKGNSSNLLPQKGFVGRHGLAPQGTYTFKGASVLSQLVNRTKKVMCAYTKQNSVGDTFEIFYSYSGDGPGYEVLLKEQNSHSCYQANAVGCPITLEG